MIKSFLFYCVKACDILGVSILVHWSLILAFVSLVFYQWVDPVMFFICFASIVPHELAHIVYARRYGINCDKVILTPLGGVALLEKSPEKPWEEFVVAVAGPICSLILALAFIPFMFLRIALVGPEVPESPELLTTIDKILLYGCAINFVIFGFNLLPIFPMDGGRMLRAFLGNFFDYLTSTILTIRFGEVLAAILSILSLAVGQLDMMFIMVTVVILAEMELKYTKTKYQK